MIAICNPNEPATHPSLRMRAVVCSTHLGAENEFNVQIQDILAGRSNYAHMAITLDQALEEGLYRRIALVTGKTWTPESEADWRQGVINRYRDNADEELYCIPSLSSGAWLTVRCTAFEPEEGL